MVKSNSTESILYDVTSSVPSGKGRGAPTTSYFSGKFWSAHFVGGIVRDLGLLVGCGDGAVDDCGLGTGDGTGVDRFVG